jgi:glycosyltransferase involved in cell wall biosynthesis
MKTRSEKTKKMFISVVSDLVTDQRVHRTSLSLTKKGFEVTLIGRRMKHSLELEERPYSCLRFRLAAESGPMFYILFNIRLFCFLLFRKADVLVANDLDTLTANFMVSRIRGIPLYYDSHEYFTGVPELSARPGVRAFWKFLERLMLPRLKHMYTVNESIADLYNKEYGVKASVIRNLPLSASGTPKIMNRSDVGLPEGKKMLLYQGAGINMHRGAEEMLEAMQFLDEFILVFVGGGDVIEKLKEETIRLKLSDRVFFFRKLPWDELRTFTPMADLGLSLDKDTNLNYRFSLPNKLFDYIQAGVPVLASDLPELRKVLMKYDIGLLFTSHKPEHLANTVREVFSDEVRLKKWKHNLKQAAAELCWEKEEEKLFEIYKDVI